jgi:hypothetical protein
MARRVWLHVGLPKTGTSFLQGVLWSNKAAVKRQGILVPASMQHHYRASLYVRGVWRERPAAEAIAADWEHLLDLVHRADGDVLISHELFAPATVEQARFAIESFGGTETHVVVTARDMARQLPAEWQQSVKQGSVHRMDDFVHDVVHRGPKARWFWRVQDLVDVADRWGADLPSDRVHLVTVPPKGADPTVLWTRFASLLGIDPDSVGLDRTRSNESLGQVEVELLRRINEARGDRFPILGSHRWFKDLLANETLAKRPDKVKFAVDEDVHEWICDTARETVAVLEQRGYDVVGDLKDLVPPPEPERGGNPSAATEEDMLRAATETIVDLLDVHRSTVKDNQRLRWLTAPQEGSGPATTGVSRAERLRNRAARDFWRVARRVRRATGRQA